MSIILQSIQTIRHLCNFCLAWFVQAHWEGTTKHLSVCRVLAGEGQVCWPSLQGGMGGGGGAVEESVKLAPERGTRGRGGGGAPEQSRHQSWHHDTLAQGTVALGITWYTILHTRHSWHQAAIAPDLALSMAPYLIYSNELNTMYSDTMMAPSKAMLAPRVAVSGQAVERCASQQIPTNNQCDNFKNTTWQFQIFYVAIQKNDMWQFRKSYIYDNFR